jgi:hypothetical protein
VPGRGPVQELRAILFDNDIRMFLTITYDGDFKPCIVDIAGFNGVYADGAGDFFGARGVEADLFWIANPDVTVRDGAKWSESAMPFNEMRTRLARWTTLTGGAPPAATPSVARQPSGATAVSTGPSA